MAPKKKAETIAELDAICDEFEHAIAKSEKTGRKLAGIDQWLRRVDPELRPWLKRELVALYRELRGAGKESARTVEADADLPLGVDPAIWRAVSRNRTFRPLSTEAKQQLASAIEPKEYAAGDTLVCAGERASGLYLILDGEVEIVVVDGEQRATIDISGRGTILGEISMITGEPCTADVVAKAPIRALVLPVDAFDEMRLDHPEIEIALSQLVSDRLGYQARDALCGKKLDLYRLQSCIGTGAMGVVYEATNESNDSRCALKMLRHRFIYNPRVVSRFEQEVDLLRGLQHPNIVSMQGHFVAYKTRFMVLDLYDGTDLRALLRDTGPLDEETAKAVLGQIADGLRHAHQNGVLHLDLKPANILIDQQGHIAITDFGLSKLIESDGCDSESVGTPLYMPPEQFTMTNVGTHCDTYALGCIAFDLVMGERLYGHHPSMELVDLKFVEPNEDWPFIESSREYRDMVCNAVRPFVCDRNVDLDVIASWARDVPELGKRLSQVQRR